ncbi:acyl carrier protein [Fictibacillus solisalsi]|uniref:Acyl carrier protein n=1 Tax=Fictibacillus solisalsi TaxID=459525 RepID=A0A1H0BQ48_9BACL|nr:acyl carrier protein [Fictibacillus solisalsi]SDN47695.1 acyl carrier protein [Fictibacillus solisalsi]
MSYEIKKQRILELIAEMVEIDVNEVKEDSDFADLGIDSLMALELAVYLERDYNIFIKEHELMNLRKVEDLLSFLKTN